jgi:hypothetical protein
MSETETQDPLDLAMRSTDHYPDLRGLTDEDALVVIREGLVRGMNMSVEEGDEQGRLAVDMCRELLRKWNEGDDDKFNQSLLGWARDLDDEVAKLEKFSDPDEPTLLVDGEQLSPNQIIKKLRNDSDFAHGWMKVANKRDARLAEGPDRNKFQRIFDWFRGKFAGLGLPC